MCVLVYMFMYIHTFIQFILPLYLFGCTTWKTCQPGDLDILVGFVGWRVGG